jgi:hypothetical protein
MYEMIRKYLLTIVFLAGFFTSFAQGPVDDISSALGSGNVGGLSRYFDNAINLTIAGSQSSYSRTQAEMVLKDFFNKNSPKGFSIEHVADNNSCKYAIGHLSTSSGSYRFYFAIRQKDGNYIIQEIRLEK